MSLDPTVMLILVVAAALVFDFANGWNDSANAIATVVSTRTLSPLAAVVFAATLNFVGALVSTKVAKTIGGGLVDPKIVTSDVVLASMLAGTIWVAICTTWGLPISGSHSLVGGLLGAAVARFGTGVIKVAGLWKVIVGLFVSPILGFIGGAVLLVIVYWIAYRMRPRTVRRTFGLLQILSSSFMAYTHGMNDAQKVMGVITLALFSAGKIHDIIVPKWVMLACATVMGLGTAAGGWGVIRTLGMKLAHIRPIEGCAAETSAGLVLSLAAAFGVPVSTTHTITGSIMGVGAARRAKVVKWGIGSKIVNAWVFTFPVTALLGGAISWLIGRLS
jgi:PiT family inorganic phosphate transporter